MSNKDIKLLRAAAVKDRLGGISNQSLWRYTRDQELGFPKYFYINNVRHWVDYELDEFIERQRAGAA